MSLKLPERPVYAGPVNERVEAYLNSGLEAYSARFVKGYVLRNPDESIDVERAKPFADRLALSFLSEHIAELCGLSKAHNVFRPAGDYVVNTMHERVRHHLGNIALILHNMEPDDYKDVKVPDMKWTNIDHLSVYDSRGSNKEALYAVSESIPDLRIPTGVSCSYVFARSQDPEYITLEIGGINYDFHGMS